MRPRNQYSRLIVRSYWPIEAQVARHLDSANSQYVVLHGGAEDPTNESSLRQCIDPLQKGSLLKSPRTWPALMFDVRRIA